MTRSIFESLSREMADAAGQDIHRASMDAFDKLTDAEIASLDSPIGPYILVRAVAMAVGPEALDNRYNVNLIAPLIRRIKRILKRRY